MRYLVYFLVFCSQMVFAQQLYEVNSLDNLNRAEQFLLEGKADLALVELDSVSRNDTNYLEAALLKVKSLTVLQEWRALDSLCIIIYRDYEEHVPLFLYHWIKALKLQKREREATILNSEAIKKYPFFLRFYSLKQDSIPFDLKKYHVEDSVIVAKGTITNGLKTGKWDYYFPTGRQKSFVDYNDQGQLQKANYWFDFYDETLQVENYKNGKPNGYCLYTYDNGRKYMEGNFKDGIPDSLLTVYYPTGVKKEEIYYKDFQRNGLYKEYAENGILIGKGRYVNGQLMGAFKGYYESGELAYETRYNNGAKVKDFKSYYRSGKIKVKGKFEYGLESGNWEEYYENGKLSATYSFDEKSRLYGTYINFFPNGDTLNTIQYKKGKKHGVARSYYSGNTVFSSELWKKGQLIKVTYQDRNRGFIGRFDKHGQVLDTFGLIVQTGAGIETGARHYNYPIGTVRRTENIRNGVLDGETFTYYETGEKRESLNYKAGVLSGPYHSFYRNGNIKEEGRYWNDDKVGSWNEYYIDGTLKSSSFYKEGIKSGFCSQYAVNGTIVKEELYDMGALIWINTFDTHGSLFETKKIRMKKGKVTVRGKLYQNSVIDTKASYVSGLKSGEFQWRYDSNMVIVSNYKNGYLHGKYFSISVDSMKEEGNYKWGNKEGKWQSWYPKDQLAEVSEFKNGSPIYSKSYFEKGTLMEEANWDNEGYLHGLQVSYYNNGKPAYKVNYVHGLKDGYSSILDSQGNTLVKLLYNGGSFVHYIGVNGGQTDTVTIHNASAEIKSHYSNGQKALTYNMKNGAPTGEYKKWYSKGNLWENSNYTHGVKNGSSKKWYENGNLSDDESFYFGVRHGKCKYYHENGNLKAQEEYLNGYLHGKCHYFSSNGSKDRTVIYFNGTPVKVLKHEN